MNEIQNTILEAKTTHFQLKACFPTTLYLSAETFNLLEKGHLIDRSSGARECLGMKVVIVPHFEGVLFTFSDEIEPSRPAGWPAELPDELIREGELAGSKGTDPRGYYEPGSWQRVLFLHGHAAGMRKHNPATASELPPAIEIAWSIIANAYAGDWSKASADWQEAATRWRDEHITPQNLRPFATAAAPHIAAAEASLQRVVDSINAIPANPPFGTASEPPIEPQSLLDAIRDIVNAARSSELESANRNVRHWREHAGKLEAANRYLRDRIKDLSDAIGPPA